MFVEDLETLPEALRDQFVPFELDGKKGFQDIETQKAYALVQTVKGEKKAVQDKFAEVEGRLSAFEQGQAEAIEKAKAEALEQAKSSGDVAAIEKQYQEQMADLEARTVERVRGEMEKEFTLRDVSRQAEIELKDIIMGLNPLDGTQDILELAVKARQKIDEAGKIVYLNVDGSASTLDKKGLIDELLQQPSIKRLVKPAHAVDGGGNANGFSKGSAASKKFEEYTGAELSVIRQENPSEYERLKNAHYN